MLLIERGGKGGGLGLSPARFRNLQEQFLYAAERDDMVRAVFLCLRRNLAATSPARVPGSTGKGWEYALVPDGQTQIAAARLAAQILQLLPTGESVRSGQGSPSDLPTMTAEQKLSELRALGVGLAEIVSDLTKELGPEPVQELETPKPETPADGQ